MNTLNRVLCPLLFVVAATPALAIDPGAAKGSLQADATRAYTLAHAYAFRDQKELRIVLSEKGAPKMVLPDLNFLTVAQAARESTVTGLILQVNPQNQKASTVTVLHPSVVSRKTGVIYNLVIAGNRVSGEVDSGAKTADGVQYRATFSAPVFTAKQR